MKKGKTPMKYTGQEKAIGFIYSCLTWIAGILLVIATLFLTINYFKYIVTGNIFDKEFIQLSAYYIIGSFLLIFVYDENCKKRFGIHKSK
jgi:uncharacterized membrane protein